MEVGHGGYGGFTAWIFIGEVGVLGEVFCLFGITIILETEKHTGKYNVLIRKIKK